VSLEVLDSMSLLALQGPKSAAVLQTVLPHNVDLRKMRFMSSIMTTIGGVDGCSITRCGYTGEDGFEISVPDSNAEQIAKKLIESPAVKLAGLAVRDSLRLEAGLCLYGHDCDETTTPVEAGLGWTIGKRRRQNGGFLGAEVILKQLETGVSKKRVGFVVVGAPAREGAQIYTPDGCKVGYITSGTFSPSLSKPIAMGYVDTIASKVGTMLQVDVRSKLRDAEVVKMPFVPSAYYRTPV